MADERFILHRYKATRFAVMVGAFLMFASFTYGYLRNGVLRWDLFAIMFAMAAGKVGAMMYLRRRY